MSQDRSSTPDELAATQQPVRDGHELTPEQEAEVIAGRWTAELVKAFRAACVSEESNDGCKTPIIALCDLALCAFSESTTISEPPQDWKDIFVEYGEKGRSQAWLYQQIAAHSRRATPSAVAPIIPAGWKLVPIEPTDEMVIAGVMEGVGDSFRVHDERQMQRMWADMLQAAPAATVAPSATLSTSQVQKPRENSNNDASGDALFQLPEMFKWWRDRFDDIEDDARGLMTHAKEYPQLHGMIEGIRVVAEQGRNGMDRLMQTANKNAADRTVVPK